jgi:hypothetical protein
MIWGDEKGLKLFYFHVSQKRRDMGHPASAPDDKVK